MNIILKDICKSFKNKAVLNNVNITLSENKIIGLLGNNGSGKTTLMKILSGLYFLDSGEIINLPMIDSNPDVCAILENPAFINGLTVRDNLKYYIDLKIDSCMEFDYYCKAFNFDFIDVKYSKLSLGMKQKVAIIYMFLKNSKLILLDEITNGLDKRVCNVFYEELKKFVKKNNSYVLISSHKIEELEPICDIVYFLKNNSIVKVIELSEYIMKNKKIFRFSNNLDAVKFSKLLNYKVEVKGNDVLLDYVNNDQLKEIMQKAIIFNDIEILDDHNSLESIYLQVMDGDNDV